MTDFHHVTPNFAVAGQLTDVDFVRAAAAGFQAVVNNRPDGEAPDQTPGASARAAAEAAGLTYHALPFKGVPGPAIVAEMTALLEANRARAVLAYCRTGTRSITAWAMSQALSGARGVDEVIALAAGAGYDLSGTRGALERLSPR